MKDHERAILTVYPISKYIQITTDDGMMLG